MKRVKALCSVGVWFLLAWSAWAQPPDQPGLTEQVTGFLNQGDYFTALTIILHALAENPEDATAREALEVVFEGGVMREQIPVLEGVFQDWTVREPDNPLAHAWLGMALATQDGREDEAEEEYQRALELDPNLPEGFWGLGVFAERQGRDEAAQSHWRRYLELDPDSHRAARVQFRLVIIDIRRVTNGQVDWMPTWSPDGQRIAFARDWKSQIWVTRIAIPDEAQPFSSGVWDDEPQWSPDGKALIFRRREPAPAGLYLQPWPLGAAERLLVPGTEKTAPPSMARWSPDGRTILYADFSRSGLFLIAPDAPEPTPLPGYRRGCGYYAPAWAPDGETLFCAGSNPADQDKRVLGLLAPQDRSQIQPWPAPDAWNMWPTPSPDGTRLVFSSDARNGQLDLWAMPWQVAAEPRLLVRCADNTGSKYAIRPDWSPDGSMIAFPYGRKIWIARLSGLDIRPLKIEATPQEGNLVVSLTSRRNEPQRVTTTYRLFDEDSVQVSEGPVGEPHLALPPEETLACPLSLDAATEPGTYTVKLTAVTGQGERVIELVDYEKP